KRDKGRLRERFEKKWKDQERKYNVNRVSETIQDNGIFWMDFFANKESKRIYSISYYLPCGPKDDAIEAKKISVCKTMFLRTLSISFNCVYTAIQKSENGNGFIELDQRGRHTNHPKTVDDDMVRSVIDHVEAFAPVPSHYTRQNSSFHKPKKDIKSMSNWITTNDGSRMPWNKVTEIVVKASHPFKIFYKTSYRDDDYQWIGCLKKAKVTPYDAPIPIDKNKHKDLMALCRTLVIPREYHLFFNNLTATNSYVVVDDSDTD
ncbi:hypothetical protein SFRURICE_006279, partial [Spodoptera frugiperda]